jgi:hypothetical protein
MESIPLSPASSASSIHHQDFDFDPDETGGPQAQRMSDEAPPKNDLTATQLLSPKPSGPGFCPWLCTLPVPIPCCYDGKQVSMGTEMLMMNRGKYHGTLREPGCYCLHTQCGGIDFKVVSTKLQSNDLNNLNVVDANGRPLVASAVVNWRIKNSLRALMDVTDYKQFLLDQSEVVLKQICSLYPYELSPISSVPLAEDKVHTSCLKTESAYIRRRAVAMLQSRVNQAGLLVSDFQLNEISYHPSVANMMLSKQHAESMLDARRAIVDGAVHIASDAVRKLKANNIDLKDDTNRLVSNLILTLCSESQITRTLGMGAV